LKQLRGTYRKDRDNPDAPEPERGRLSPPAWLNRSAKLEWRRKVKELDELNLASDFDRPLLAAFCQAYSRLQELERIVEEKGFTFVTERGYVCQRPEISLAQKQAQLVRSLGAEFGMGPSARTRIRVPPKTAKNTAFNSLRDRFFGSTTRTGRP
jgi:P27 family predicted phage terminase small subunit